MGILGWVTIVHAESTIMSHKRIVWTENKGGSERGTRGRQGRYDKRKVVHSYSQVMTSDHKSQIILPNLFPWQYHRYPSQMDKSIDGLECPGPPWATSWSYLCLICLSAGIKPRVQAIPPLEKGRNYGIILAICYMIKWIAQPIWTSFFQLEWLRWASNTSCRCIRDIPWRLQDMLFSGAHNVSIISPSTCLALWI